MTIFVSVSFFIYWVSLPNREMSNEQQIWGKTWTEEQWICFQKSDFSVKQFLNGFCSFHIMKLTGKEDLESKKRNGTLIDRSVAPVHGGYFKNIYSEPCKLSMVWCTLQILLMPEKMFRSVILDDGKEKDRKIPWRKLNFVPAFHPYIGNLFERQGIV